ncbi:MAG: class I SAM-dependent methyltransferase [Candidatus Magasanikbacteria bacterium]|nr:class I SAM-dependent methyltransferase [Candidatus Magasanikbacteria bacterium]
MSFNYEQSLWGRGSATPLWSDPTSFRLRQALSALRLFPAGARVLEVGCGAGQFIRGIKKLRPELDCHGCDISVKAIDSAKGYADSVAYAISSEQFLYENNFFDAVLIFDVLEHVENPAALLAEMSRVLKPGGIAYCFVPCEGDVLSLWHLLEKLHLKRDLTKKHAGHINYFSRQSLLALISSHFSVISLRYSEHLLGQIIGVVAFFLMDYAAKKRGLAQINNETYFRGQSSGPFKLIKIIVNSLIYLESVIFSRVPSPNVHVTLCKNKL